ncbi:MAG: aspartate aminotransferase [Clostridiaceae bacterium]|nr:aspartate aminotransferase [Clostridiaceae bacterium]
MMLSKKALQIEPSITLAITATAKKMKAEGIDVVGFGAGEPDFNTPENIQQAAINAIKKGFTKYTVSSGIMELKEAIIKKLGNENNIKYNASQIIISTGAKQCLANVFQAILNPGDQVLIPIPYWVSYPELVKLADGIPVFVNTSESNNFKYTIEELEKSISPNTKAILINSPNNPTGTVYSKEELLSLSEFAKKHDIFIISDEIYEKLIYGNEEHISIASLSDDAYNRTIVINGVSKTYSMTGWRIGYAAGPEQVIKLMSNIQSHTTSNANSIAQYASVEALNGDKNDVERMIQEFAKRRNYMVERLEEINGLSCINPQGAFYVMVNLYGAIGKKVDNIVIKDSIIFSKLLLEKEKVAVIPGAAFGMNNYMRLSYAISMENIKKGLDRINRFMESIE